MSRAARVLLVLIVVLDRPGVAGGLAARFDPAKDAFVQGEPAAVRVRLENVSAEKLILMMDYPFSPAAEFSCRDKDAEARGHEQGSDMYMLPTVTLRPGQAYETMIAMRRYFRFRVPKRYEIAYRVSFYIDRPRLEKAQMPPEPEEPIEELRLENLDSARSPHVDGTFAIRIRPGAVGDDEARRLQEGLRRALRGPLSHPDLWLEDPANRAAREAVEMMCWLDHPAAIESLELAAGKVAGADGSIVRALARFAHTKEGRAALVRAMDAIRPGYLQDAFSAYEEELGDVPEWLLRRFLTSADRVASWQTVQFLRGRCWERDSRYVAAIERLLKDTPPEVRGLLREAVEQLMRALADDPLLGKSATQRASAPPEDGERVRTGTGQRLVWILRYSLAGVVVLFGLFLLVVLRRRSRRS